MFFRDKRVEKWFSASKLFISICFYTNQVHFKLWSVVKLFFEIWHVLNISVRNCQVRKKMTLSLTRLKLLIQKLTRCTKNVSKTDFFFKNFDPSSFFWMKTIFSATTFPRMHKKDNNDVFTVYIDQLSHFLRASFPKNFDFLEPLFSSKTEAL